MGVYEERAPPTTGMHWQPANSQERGSGLSLGCQGGGGASLGGSGPGSEQQTRDLSPCLPASMGDAARPTTLPSSPTPPLSQQQQQQQSQSQQPGAVGHTTSLPPHQTHCGTNNNCYEAGAALYDSRDYGSPTDSSEYRNNNYEHHPGDHHHPPPPHHQQNHPHLHPQHHPHHQQHHPHPHHQHQQTILHQSQGQPPPGSEQHHHHHGSEHAIPKLEPASTPPLHQESHEVGQMGGPGHQGNAVVAVCAGCGLKISDRFYLQAVDRRWHASCLQCCHCRRGLDGEVTCFSKEGNIYCKKDYYSMFGSMRRCSRCRAGISAKELVMRVRDLVFHVGCFSCAACGVPLKRGDQFGMREGAVLCRLHYEMEAAAEQLRPAQSPPLPLGYAPGPHYPGPHPAYPSPEFLHHPLHRHPAPGQPPPNSMHPGPPNQQQPIPGQQPGGPQSQGPQQAQMSPGPMQPGTPIAGESGSSPPKIPYFNGTSPVVAAAAQQVQVPPPRQKGRPRKRKPKDLEAMTASLGESYLSAEYMDMPFGRGPGTPGMPGSNSRTKRMRTSFKHHQLRTMKSYFAINHNPDAKDLKQLSQKTGLPKRVLQVWFQNARAKWRRMVLKQEGKSDKCGGGGGTGPGGGLGPGPGGGMHDPSGLSELDLYGAGAGGGQPMSPGFVLGGPHSPASLGSSLDCA